jgi:glycine cleavage system aminomethyltransferase T
VCRIDTRGHVNRYLRRLSLAGDLVPEAGADIVVGDNVVGSITSAARSPERGVVALGFVRREVEPPAPVEIRAGSGSVAATVVA